MSTWCHGIAHLMAAFAATRGEIDQGAIDGWMDTVRDADERGHFLVSVVPILTTAVRLARV